MNLSQAAQRGSMKARTDLQNKIMLNQAKGAAIGSVVQGAAAGYMRSGAPDGLQRTATTSSKFNEAAQQTDGYTTSLYNQGMGVA